MCLLRAVREIPSLPAALVKLQILASSTNSLRWSISMLPPLAACALPCVPSSPQGLYTRARWAVAQRARVRQSAQAGGVGAVGTGWCLGGVGCLLCRAGTRPPVAFPALARCRPTGAPRRSARAQSGSLFAGSPHRAHRKASPESRLRDEGRAFGLPWGRRRRTGRSGSTNR